MSDTPPISRRTLTSLAAATFVSTLAGCSASNDPDGLPAREKAREGTIMLENSTSKAFASKASWKATRASGAPVIATPEGILTFLPSDEGGTYRAGLLDEKTGEPYWSTRPFASPHGMARIGWTQQNGRAWVVVAATQEDSLFVYGYDPMAGGRDARPASSARFEGESKAKPPTVTVGGRGVLVNQTKYGPPRQFHPASGKTTLLSGGPERSGRAGTPLRVHDDGWLLAFSAGGFAYATDNGGWDSMDIAPQGVDSEAGAVLSERGGLLLVAWPTPDESDELVLHRIADGKALIRHREATAVLEEQKPLSLPLLLSTDGRTAAWGNVVFDLDSQETREVKLDGSQPSAIHAGVLYAGRPQNTDASGTGPRPAPSNGTASSGARVVDLEANDKDLSSGVNMVPVAFSRLGQGIFVPGNSDIYAISLK